MKQTIKFIVLGIAAALVGFAAMCVAIMLGASDSLAIATYFAVAAVVAVALGLFDMSAIKRGIKHTSIKDASSYGQAAIFVGTACLFTGTQRQCEDLCDDLWHHGQQTHVEMLTGEEVFNIL